MKRRLLALLVAVVMLVGLLPIMALAADEPNVACIDEQEYATLADAFADAKAGDTITLLTDLDLSDWTSVDVNKAITLDGDNKTITGLKVPLIGSLKGAATIKNLKIVDPAIVSEGKTDEARSVGAVAGWVEVHTGSVTIDNVSVTGGSVTSAYPINDDYLAYAGGLVGWAKNVIITNCSVENVVVTGTNATGGVIGQAYEVVVEEVTISGNTVTSTGDNAKKVGTAFGSIAAAVKIDITEESKSTTDATGDTSISASESIIGRITTANIEVVITGGEYFADPTAVAAGSAAVPTTPVGYEIIHVNGHYVLGASHPVAEIGSATYASIQDAIDAAAKGDTITLVEENITEPGIKVAADQDLVIDLNGNTLTGDIFSEGTLTVKNGTINSNTFTSAIESYGQSASLTVEDLTATSQRHALRIEGGTAVINSGTFTTVGREGETETVHALNAGGAYSTTVVIYDGNFFGLGSNAENPDSSAAVNAQNNATVTIFDGVFAGGQNDTLAVSGDGKLVISGGLYDQEPEAGYLDKSCKSAESGDMYEVYRVVAKIGEEEFTSLEEAIAAAKKGDEITLVYSSEEEIVIKKAIKFTLRLDDGVAFSGTIEAGRGYTLKEKDGVYTVKRRSTGGGGGGSSSGGSIGQDEWKNPYTDVKADDWFYEGVEYVTVNGMMNGTEDGTTFSPAMFTTRGMLMTMLARLDGVDTTGTPWYAVGTKWAEEKGVADKGDPTVDITREEIALMLWRYAGSPSVIFDALANCPDGDKVSENAREAMNWAVYMGIFEGNEKGEIMPLKATTRMELATIMMRYCEKILGK